MRTLDVSYAHMMFLVERAVSSRTILDKTGYLLLLFNHDGHKETKMRRVLRILGVATLPVAPFTQK